MSSSPRKKALDSATSAALVGALPCPQCGAETLVTVRGDCTLLDGTLIKDLQRLRCSNCGANVFDRAAMQEIRRQRGKKVEA